MPDTGDAMLDAPGDRTSVLLRFHQSLELPKREPIRWQVEPDETYTGDDLKRWIQWHIWLKYWVWIELEDMWLNVLELNGDGDLIHHRQLRRSEQVLEVLRQVDSPLQIEARRNAEARRNDMTVSEPARKRPRIAMPDVC